MTRRGFTLVEALIVILVMGLLVAIAIPRLRGTLTRHNVDGSRNTVASLYGQARIIAMQQARPAGLRFVDNRVFVSSWSGTGTTYDTIGSVHDLNAEYGVTVTSSTNPIVVDAKGITQSDDVVIRMTRDSYTDSLSINRYGRIRK